MPINNKGKGSYTLTSPKSGKKLASGSKAYVEKRARAIAYFRSQGHGKKTAAGG
jgi:hypothetical protein